MACQPVAPERPARQPANKAPEASLPLDASVLSIVAGLEGHDLDGLRRQWRAHLGGEPPLHLPRWLLVRGLAYRKRCFDPIFKFPCARAIIRGVIWRSACAYARA